MRVARRPPDITPPAQGQQSISSAFPTGSGVFPPFTAPGNPAAARSLPLRLTQEGGEALRRGMAAFQAGRNAEAIEALQKAARNDPHVPIVRAYLGLAYLRQKRYADALKQFEVERGLLPNPAFAWAHIADVHYAQGHLPAAIQALEKAASLQPDLAQVHYNLGMLYPQALQLNKAIESLERYSALEPGNHYALYLRGSLLYKLARLDDAERALQEAIRLEPHVGLYHFALAQVFFRRTPTPQTTERARAELQMALEMGAPEPAAVYYYLGLCSQRQGDWESARRQLETSVQMAPEAWGAYYALAEVLQKLGRPEEARKARARFAALRAQEDMRMQRAFYTQEVQRNPDSAAAHLQLAQFLSQQGEYNRASEALARAHRLAERQKEEKGLRRRIADLAAELRRKRRGK